jgi:hypothetical protein
VRGVPDVLDTATLFLNDRLVRLFGVEWVRGAGDPDDLVRYLKGREVVCQPASQGETHRCTVEGRDLSTVVLYNGGGKASAEATAELRNAEEHAKRMRLGVWSEKVEAVPDAP